MNTGEHAWMVPAGAGDRIRNLPQLKGLTLPALGGDSTFSGPLATSTLLVYALTTGGSTGGPRLVALDKALGQGTGLGRSAGPGDRHADDLPCRWAAVHRHHRPGTLGAGRAGTRGPRPAVKRNRPDTRTDGHVSR